MAKEIPVLCGKDGCKFKKSKENKYCGKHQLCLFADETVALNKKVCYSYIRGCREQLELDYKFSKCQACLEKDRKKDNEKRAVVILKNKELLSNKIITTKLCTTCCKELDVEEFVGENNDQTKTCKTCRTDNKVQDGRRDKTHRNEVVRGSTRAQYTEYKKNANIRNLEFVLTYDDYVSIVKNECYYCGILQERGINGIDRVDSNVGYLSNNCVSCCQICNYMKRILPFDVFIKKIEHILVYQNKISGNLYPECFTDHINVSYRGYKSSAKARNIEFVLTEEEFYNITRNNCYICGKLPSDTHKNGIDRFDNNLGYIIENSRACCCECNLMKRIHTFDEVLDRFVLINQKHKV